MNLLLKYRILLSGFMLGLALSGLTAFPLTWELNLLVDWLSPHRETFPSLFEWIARVRNGLVETDAKYPFLAYGTDWLAFAHLYDRGGLYRPLARSGSQSFHSGMGDVLLRGHHSACVHLWPDSRHSLGLDNSGLRLWRGGSGAALVVLEMVEANGK